MATARGSRFIRSDDRYILKGKGQWVIIGTHQIGNLTAVETVGFGFTTMNGFHIKGMAKIKWNAFIFASVGQPIINVG